MANAGQVKNPVVRTETLRHDRVGKVDVSIHSASGPGAACFSPALHLLSKCRDYCIGTIQLRRPVLSAENLPKTQDCGGYTTVVASQLPQIAPR